MRSLFVDLDGTLISTDSLWESLLQLLRHAPWAVVLLPAWLTKGRAYLKRRIADRVRIDPTLLPYRQAVIDYIQQAKKQSQPIILATAADRSIAMGVAEHLQLFDDVLASDGRNNLESTRKLEAIQRTADGSQFDYIGNAWVDLPIWQAAGRALVVNPSAALSRAIEHRCPIHERLDEPHGGLQNVLKAMRIHQWVKNLLVLVPLILAHKVNDPGSVGQAMIAFISFSLCASCAYLINDLLDLEFDRQHAQKRHRPFASGRLDIRIGVVLMPALLLGALILCISFLPSLFAAMLLGYVLLTSIYSLYLKQKLMIDVLMLGGFYAYRVLAGAVAISVAVSPWLLAFSIFFFLSLAFVKRYADLDAVSKDQTAKLTGRGYCAEDLAVIRVVGPTSGYLSVLVLALYINSNDTVALYSQPEWLWLICLCLLYWLTRVWFLVHRGHMPHDPVMFAIRDRVSYGVSLMVLILIAMASI